MLKIGVTGGIGSGKSVVCQIFGILGIPVYHSDEMAKQLIETNPIIHSEIINAFGKNSYTSEGYNRKYIAYLVFKNSDLLTTLNNIVHPKVKVDFENWCKRQNYVKYVIQEAAILFESGADKIMDKVIVVDAPLKLRLARLKERDSVSEEEILSRINNQWPSDKIKSMADWIIFNDDNKLILPQVLSIHHQILNSDSTNG